MKKLLVILLVLWLILPGCTSGKKGITEDEAIAIVLADLGVSADEASFHVHASVDKVPQYTVYVTVGTRTMEYVVRMVDGKILSAEESSHSH